MHVQMMSSASRRVATSLVLMISVACGAAEMASVPRRLPLALSGVFDDEHGRTALLRVGSQTLPVQEGYPLRDGTVVETIAADHVVVAAPDHAQVRMLFLPGAERDHVVATLHLLEQGRKVRFLADARQQRAEHGRTLRAAEAKLELLCRHGVMPDLVFRVLRWELRQQVWLLEKIFPRGELGAPERRALLERFGARIPLAVELVKGEDLDAGLAFQVAEAIRLESALIGRLTAAEFSGEELKKARHLLKKGLIVAEWLEERTIHDPRFR